MLPGLGVSAGCDGKSVLAGNEKLLRENGIVLSDRAKQCAERHISQGCTVVYIAVNGKFVGLLALSDTLRKESADMIKRMEQIGVSPLLLTGDHKAAASAIAVDAADIALVDDEVKELPHFFFGGKQKPIDRCGYREGTKLDFQM